MEQTYKNKVCIVSGAASGIGMAVAKKLHSLGAIVYAVDMNLDGLEEIYKPLENVNTRFLDITDYQAFSALIQSICSQRGELDYLFNIAGITIAGAAKDLTIEQWRKVLAVDIDGVVNGATLAYKQMVKQGHGHIVNLSSIQGLIPIPMEAPYVTAKFAVAGLSQALRVEGAPLGVNVSVVCPGFVKTPIFETSEMVGIDREAHKESISKYEKFAISPAECAEVILKHTVKNKAIIPVTLLAKVYWLLYRLSPTFMINLLTKDLRKSNTIHD